MQSLLIYQLLFLFGVVITGFVVGWWYLRNLSLRVNKVLGHEGEEGNAELQMLRRLARIEAKLEEIEPRLNLAEAMSKIAVQKVGFLRFNPFQDTGGDNSFVAVLLDSKNDGFLISSLYTREGVRIYGKNIVGGRSRHALSEEERKVLEETISRNL